MRNQVRSFRSILAQYRLYIAIGLVSLFAILKVVIGPNQVDQMVRGGAETVAADLPAVAVMDQDPRRAFAGALGRALTFGFEIDEVSHTHVTVLTWVDVDRTNLRLNGAVLDIPKEYFVTHPLYLGCDLATYNRGKCRFMIDFATGSPKPMAQTIAIHDFKTSDASSGLSNHL